MEHPAEQAVASACDAIANVPEGMVGTAGLGAGGEGKKGYSSRSCQQRFVGHWVLNEIWTGATRLAPDRGLGEENFRSW